jgi:NAD(P)-dependent dehydrogenase (short-subunit alcohol dehydrogenase family)
MQRTALVTGAASGIGAASARLLAREGTFVYCADRDERGLASVVAEIGSGGAASLPLDVTDEAAWAGAMQLVHERQDLSVLVHAAGIVAASPIRQTSLAEWRRVIATNLDGAFLATRHGIEAMHRHGGAIVLVGSASGIRPAPGAAAYSTSKAGLAMLARTTARECRDAGIPVRINVVSPGGVKTPLWRTMPFFQDLVQQHGSEDAAYEALAGSGPPFATAEAVAGVVGFLASPAAGQITGVELPMDGGYVL